MSFSKPLRVEWQCWVCWVPLVLVRIIQFENDRRIDDFRTDTTIRAIGKRAHPLHNIVYFSSQCVIVSTVA